jgi:hypothetical protein
MVMTEARRTARRTLDIADGEYSAIDTAPFVGMVRENVAALIAATFPVRPPAAWFDNPKLTEVTPLTVGNDGRAFGHIATWRQSHIGLAGGIRPPRSRAKYAFFATGALETAEGKRVNVGQITLSGGHAPLEASVADAVAHYDNTNSAVMDVAVGEDKIGVWVAGALRPDIDEVKLRAIRASSVSGDWRPINGGLELVAVCAVNVPGFPIPRARVAGGQPVALVAAGTEDLAYIAILDRAGIDIKRGIDVGMAGVNERVQRLEQALTASANTQARKVSRAIRNAKRITAAAGIEVEEPATDDERLTALRSRVRPDAAPSPDVDAIRARVHGTKAEPEAAPLPTAEELRARVYGTDVELDAPVDTPDSAPAESGEPQPVSASAVDALRQRVKGAKK